MNPVYLDRMADKEPKQKRRRRIAILVVGIAVLAIVVVGWLLLRSRSQSTAGASDKASQTPTVLVSHVVSKDVDRQLKLPGELRAFQDVPIYPKVQGFVEVNIDERKRIGPESLRQSCGDKA